MKKITSERKTIHTSTFFKPPPFSGYLARKQSDHCDHSEFQFKASLFGLFGLCLLLTLGCHREQENTQSVSEAASPLSVMQSAVQVGDWKTAWAASHAVLIAHPNDPQILSEIARVAHESHQPDAAASLLVDAARANSLSDSVAVQRAMHGLITVGRVFDGIDLLSDAIEQHPDQDETRRWLFDFLVIMENHDAATPHGQALIRKRKFDFELLLALSNTEKRDLEDESLEQVVTRNAADQRPRLGKAKTQFDAGHLPEAENLLREILKSYPNYNPAQLLLGRTLTDSGQFDRLADWFDGLSGDYESHWSYWLVLGDWARSQGKTSQAARAYWESTRRNPDVLLVWSKLSTALSQLDAPESGLPNTAWQHAQQRAAVLSRLYHEKELFDRADRKSNAIAARIANSLGVLGRLWEAEAWAAMAMTLPKADSEADSKLLETTRNSIVGQLRRDTPWQVNQQHPELQLDLTHLPTPSLGNLAESKHLAVPQLTVPSVMPVLLDEAVSRGIEFFGKTRDDLDQPGVPIYAELGCGGGSLDFDLDGWTDLYLLAAGGMPPAADSQPNALFRNLGGRFIAVTKETQTGDTGFGQGVAIGDVNEDGFADLFLLNYGNNCLFVNNGDGTFRNATEQLLPPPDPKWSTSGAIADLDGDGLSDIYIANYCAGYDPITVRCKKEETGEVRSCAPIRFVGEIDTVLKGTPNGTFADVTTKWEVNPSLVGRGLGVVVGALDGDLGLDVYVANDMSDNHYWNQIKGDDFKMNESALSRGLSGDDRSSSQGSMGIASGDFDRDGDIDLYVTNFAKEYNTYYQRISNGAWQDKTVQEGLAEVTLPMVGFGTQAVDFDNDGNLELVVSNGHVDLPSESDSSPYAQPMQIFRRTPTARFELAIDATASPYLKSLHVGRSLWTLDVNRDGQTDLVVTHQTEPVALLLNHTKSTHHWIALSLRGRNCARDAIGAIIELQTADQKWVAMLTSGDGYLCSNERVVRFGLGSINSDFTVTVRWPDGSSQQLYDLAVDTDWLVVQNSEPFRLSIEKR